MLHLVKKIYDLLFAYLQQALQRKLTLLSPAKGNQGRESSNFKRLASFREHPVWETFLHGPVLPLT